MGATTANASIHMDDVSGCKSRGSYSVFYTPTGGADEFVNYSWCDVVVQRLFIAYYGRPADPGGLKYWRERLGQYANGEYADAPLEFINAFGESEEYRHFMGGNSNAENVRLLYRRLFGREPDQGGLNFYVDKLDKGEMSLATIAQNILDGVSGSNDSHTLDFSITIAKEYARMAKLYGAPTTSTQKSSVGDPLSYCLIMMSPVGSVSRKSPKR